MSGAKISVIVPTLNEEKYLEKLLVALKWQTLPRHLYEIIIVDGYSTDRTVDIAKNYADIIIKARAKAPAARNIGAKRASGEILVFLDADTIPSPSLLSETVKVFRDKTVAAAAYPYVFDDFDSLPAMYAANRANAMALLALTFVRGVSLPGNAMAVRKWVFLKVGGFPNVWPGEDMEFTRKLIAFCRQRGMRIEFIKSALVIASSRRIKKMGLWKTFFTWIRERGWYGPIR